MISYLVLCCSLPRVRSICMQLKKWNSKGVWLFVASSTSYSGAMERRKAPSAQDVQSLGVRHPTSGWPKHSGAKGFHHCHINIFIHCPSLSAFGGQMALLVYLVSDACRDVLVAFVFMTMRKLLRLLRETRKLCGCISAVQYQFIMIVYMLKMDLHASHDAGTSQADSFPRRSMTCKGKGVHTLYTRGPIRRQSST